MEKQVKFAISMSLFWIKGLISVDKRFIKVEKSNTLLGFIPAGKDKQTIPLRNVSASTISSQYRIKPMIIGLLILMLALQLSGQSFLTGMILLLIGVGVFGSGIETLLVIQRAGADYYVPVPFFEKSKMLAISDAINESLAYEADKTDLNNFFVAQA